MTENNKVSLKTDRLFSIMDGVDVRDELIELKDHFESIVSTSNDKVTRYKASYSAVALAEAGNAINFLLRHPDLWKEVKQDV